MSIIIFTLQYFSFLSDLKQVSSLYVPRRLLPFNSFSNLSLNAMKENSQLEIIEQNSNSLSHTQLEQSKASIERKKSKAVAG